jgi:hypothetical protein
LFCLIPLIYKKPLVVTDDLSLLLILEKGSSDFLTGLWPIAEMMKVKSELTRILKSWFFTFVLPVAIESFSEIFYFD